MRLRIVSGSLRGRVVLLNDRTATFRPTKDRCRESVAEILKEAVKGALVADVCAGSGAFGFEMISRGAREAHFVDSDRRLISSINEHALKFGVEKQCRGIVAEVPSFIARNSTSYDILFYDPPYDDETLAAQVPSLLGMLSDRGILAYERSRSRIPAALTGDAADAFVLDTRIYGDTAVDIYRRAQSPA